MSLRFFKVTAVERINDGKLNHPEMDLVGNIIVTKRSLMMILAMARMGKVTMMAMALGGEKEEDEKNCGMNWFAPHIACIACLNIIHCFICLNLKYSDR